MAAQEGLSLQPDGNLSVVKTRWILRNLGDWRRNPSPPRRRQSKLSGSQSHMRLGSGVFLVVTEGEHALVMKLLPVDLTGLQELVHLLTVHFLRR